MERKENCNSLKGLFVWKSNCADAQEWAALMPQRKGGNREMKIKINCFCLLFYHRDLIVVIEPILVLTSYKENRWKFKQLRCCVVSKNQKVDPRVLCLHRSVSLNLKVLLVGKAHRELCVTINITWLSNLPLNQTDCILISESSGSNPADLCLWACWETLSSSPFSVYSECKCVWVGVCQFIESY